MLSTGRPASGSQLDRVLVAGAVELLLDDRGPFGWSRVHPYRKWQGAHWRLISLVDLGVGDDPRLVAMLDRVLDWLTDRRRLGGVPVIDGRARRCASQEGNALLVASRLGRAADASVLAEHLVGWQWPDGGWNCDTTPSASHSSFHETVWPLRGLVAYHEATGDRAALDTAGGAGHLLLRHRLLRSVRTGDVIDRQWLRIHWPPYWHYDALQGLRAIAALGWLGRDGAGEGLAWLRELGGEDGAWKADGRRWWRPPGRSGSGIEVVDWGPLADAVVTLEAAAILSAV